MPQWSSFLDTGDKVSSIAAAVLALVGLWGTWHAGRRRRRLPGAKALRPLLTAQRSDAARHRYRFYGEHVPALTDLYVRSRAAAVGPQPDKSHTIPAARVLAEHRHAVLLGDAGAGKSTFLATVAGDLARRALARRGGGETAVIVHASDLVDHSVPEAIVRATRRDLGVVLSPDIFERPSSSGHAWRVLIDGLDEVVMAEDRSKLLWHIRDLLHDGGPYRFLLTCRPLPRSELVSLDGPDVGVYDLRPFDRAELDEFAHRWFAARFPRDRRRADETAARFLARVAGARLGPVARIPLLATIAALVYEFDDGRALPSSRAALYDRFVAHLLDGRRSLDRFREALEPELLSRGEPGRLLAEWLFADIRRHVGGLLEAAGSAWLADPDVDLVEVAAERLVRDGPYDLAAVTPDGTRLLRDLLLAAGVCTLRQERVVFVHRSFAEYFAALAGAATFHTGSWLAQAANPAARSFVAFAASRRPDADDLVVTLLERGEFATAGDLVADGVPVRPQTAIRVTDALLRQIADETDQAPEALRILGDLSFDATVLHRLVELASDDDVPIWTRALVAGRVADIDPVMGNRLLAKVADDADDFVRSWIADALEEHGGRVDPFLRFRTSGVPAMAAGPPPGVLARHAIALRLADARTTEWDRLAAARQLAQGGDPEPLRALADAPGINPLHRVDIATALADIGEPDLLRRLGRAAPSPQVLYLAALRLYDRSDNTAIDALGRVAERYPDLPMAFGAAARVADCHDLEPLRRLVRHSGQSQIRLAAARRLAQLGEIDALGWMLHGPVDPRLEAAVRLEMLRAGRRDALPGLVDVIRRHPRRVRRTIELQYLMAAYGDPRSRLLLRRQAGGGAALDAIWAAVVLADLGDPYGLTVLRRIATQRSRRIRTRMRAAVSLVNVNPQLGAEVLTELAHPPRRAMLRLEAASTAVRRFGEWRFLESLAFDSHMPVRVRREALAAFTIRGPGDDESPLARSPELRARVAALAKEPTTPTPLRLPASAALGDDETHALLRSILESNEPAGVKANTLGMLAALDPQAAEAGWSALLRDARVSRVRRWLLAARHMDDLADADAETILDRVGDIDDIGIRRWATRALRLALQRPERVLDKEPQL
ncbi:NACHT domain-containing protein [Nucisporomicrobium flavum]|uniref:NACHT domain-containing protein n=1 Tax=Nucisporomicrobium flavum TaxID=2785915 RepID=UPI0018F63ACC|nr:NACHT domain-containing protein [Nucisporomicrobium flavum]